MDPRDASASNKSKSRKWSAFYKYVWAVRQSFEERPIELPNQSINPIKIIGWLPNGPATKMTMCYFCYQWNPLVRNMPYTQQNTLPVIWVINIPNISCKLKKSNQYKHNHMLTTPKHSVCVRTIFGWQRHKFIILHCQYEAAFKATVWCVIL